MWVSSLLIGLGTSAWAQQQPCPDRNDRLDLIDEAEAALVEADLATVDRRLRRLDEAWGCGPVADGELLGRVWLVEGAYLVLQGDIASGSEAWRAAGRVAPGEWVSEFGDRLRELYEAALDVPQGRAEIVVMPPLFQYLGTVDGQQVRFPFELDAGLHLVQVGPTLDSVEFARSLIVAQDTSSVVQTGLLEGTSGNLPAPPAPPATPGTSTVQVRKLPVFEAALALHIGGGAQMAMGRGIESVAGSETAVKLLLPLETGLVLRPGRSWWLRPTVMTAPLIGTELLYTDSRGQTDTPAATPAALGAQLAGGGTPSKATSALKRVGRGPVGSASKRCTPAAPPPLRFGSRGG